jgi:ATP phosphoribosyltransferase
MVKIIKSRIKGFIDSQRYVMVKYNVNRTNLDAASKIAPGKRSPTVMTLHNGGEGEWCAVEVMIEKSLVAVKMDELWEVGAKDILVIPLLNTRTTD